LICNSIKVLSLIENQTTPKFTSIANCGVSDPSKRFLERWLDITKSLLFFSKGILFVEGIAEALVIKELAKTVLTELKNEFPDKEFYSDLEEYGISIINLNGIYFKHFYSLFQGFKWVENEMQKCDSIPVRCSGITDNDPPADSQPVKESPAVGKNPQLNLIGELQDNSPNCRLYTNLKTFEYDLALEGNNISKMSSVLLKLINTKGPVKKRLEENSVKDWLLIEDATKAVEAHWLLNQIDEAGKGEFAQTLADGLGSDASNFVIPSYIKEAIKWLVCYE